MSKTKDEVIKVLNGEPSTMPVVSFTGRSLNTIDNKPEDIRPPYKKIYLEMVGQGITPSKAFWEVQTSLSEESLFSRIEFKWWEKVYNFFRWRIFDLALYCKVKWKLQTYFRGYSDYDCFDLDASLSNLIIPRLRGFRDHLRKNGRGVPSSLFERASSEDASMELWISYVSEMLWAFEFSQSEVSYFADDWAWIRYHNGMRLFTEYLRNLWD